MTLAFNSAMRYRPIEDILLFVQDSSIEEGRRIIEDLGRGSDELYVTNELLNGAFTIKEISMSYEGSLLCCIVDNITFQGGPHKNQWFDGNLQRVLYDTVLYGITEFGTSRVAEVVGLNYGL